MSLLSTAQVVAAQLLEHGPLLAAGDEHHFDDQGYTSHHWLLPETAEIIYGGLAAVLVIGALVWKAGPLVKKAMGDRTAKIQGELDASATARQSAETEAAQIRQSLGDIEAERQRLLADADTQAEALLNDGRRRIEAEAAELESRADAEIAAAGSRSGDELRSEISRHASAAADRVVAQSLDEATHQRLIEDFIAKVGATAS